MESLPFLATALLCAGVGGSRFYELTSRAPFSAVAWAVGAVALVWASRYVHGLWRVPRERAFLRALPFDVPGYLSNLERHPSRCARVKVEVELTKKPSEAIVSELARWAASAGANVDSCEGRVVKLVRDDITSYGKSGATNAPMWRAQRRIVTRVLQPLHAKSAIRKATFSR